MSKYVQVLWIFQKQSCGFSITLPTKNHGISPKTMEFPHDLSILPRHGGVGLHSFGFCGQPLGRRIHRAPGRDPPKNRIWQEMIGTWSFKRFKASSLGGFYDFPLAQMMTRAIILQFGSKGTIGRETMDFAWQLVQLAPNFWRLPAISCCYTCRFYHFITPFPGDAPNPPGRYDTFYDSMIITSPPNEEIIRNPRCQPSGFRLGVRILGGGASGL